MSTLLYVGILLLSGLFFGKLAHRIGFPNVTGYLIAGLIIGPHALGIVPIEAVDGISIVSELALGFIALSIGAELEWSYFKKLGTTSLVIAVFESLFAMGFVVIALLVFRFELPLALMLGAIASATAPAATIMVIRQYRAKGPLTRTLLSVVAIDDAIAIIAFGFAATFAKTISSGISFSIMTLLYPFIELGLSIVIGAVFAMILLIPLHFFKMESNRMCGILGVISITSAVAAFTGASSLLACMVLGIVLVNTTKEAEPVLKITNMISPPIFMIFFVISGAELDVALIPSIGVIGVIYIIFRALGKLLGATLGATIMKAPEVVQKYLGWTLLPQAGVALGLSLVAVKIVPEYSAQIRTVVLCATLIYELIGPIISKMALTKAGEIKALPK